MEQYTFTKEELMEIAKKVTSHLDDRLCPYSREELRAEAWLEGISLVKRHQQAYEKEIDVVPEPNTYPFLIRKEIRAYFGYWLVCTKDFGFFFEGEHYWLELLENGNICGRSDNVKGKEMMISIADLLNNFKATGEKV